MNEAMHILAGRAIGIATALRTEAATPAAALSETTDIIGAVAKWHALNRESELSVLTHLLAFLVGRWAVATDRSKQLNWKAAALSVTDIVRETMKDKAS